MSENFQHGKPSKQMLALWRRSTTIRSMLLVGIFMAISGCSTLNHAVNLYSQLQLPITYQEARNEPSGTVSRRLARLQQIRRVLPPAHEGEAPTYVELSEDVEVYPDLTGRRHLVGIALSGGGARAAFFSAFTLQALEKKIKTHSLFEDAELYSSVSGGSLINAFIAIANDPGNMSENSTCLEDANLGFLHVKCARLAKIPTPCYATPAHVKTFVWIAQQVSGNNSSPRCGNLGDIASKTVLSPFNFGTPLLFTLTTNQGYSRYLSIGLDWCLRLALKDMGTPKYSDGLESLQDISSLLSFNTKFSPIKVNQGGGKTRHYFNATILETGERFVFSNKALYRKQDASRNHRLPNIVLLEDLNSSNEEFSLADATVASMSFPGATEPVRLHIYKEKGIKSDRKSLGTIDIIDGGIADNTGLATLFDVFLDEVEVTKAQEQRLTVLLIDADNSTASNFSTLLANRHEENPTPLFSLDWPFKGGDKGLDSTFALHDISQRRELALLLRQTADRLTQLK